MNWLANILKALGRGMRDLSPNCKRSVRLQSTALDTKLPFRQRLGLWIHLMLCKWCRRYGKQIGFLRMAARGHGESEHALPPRSLPPEARDRIKQRLQSEKK